MKRAIGIFALVVGLLIVLSAASVGIIVYNQKNPKVSYPTEGIWFCEELDMQINFDGINDNFAKIGDEYYACLFFANRGASAMSIICQDTDMEGYELGQSVFSGEYVSGDSQSFSVRSKSDSRVYTFTRNDSYISIPATQYLRIDGIIYSLEEINAGFQSVLYNEMTDPTNPGKESCCSADYLSGKELTYDLYCAQENRETKSDLDYSNEVYLYAVITSVDAKAVDQDVETHMFAFSIDYEGVKSSLSDEVHSPDDELSAFLPKDAEIIGSFTMQKIGEGSLS